MLKKATLAIAAVLIVGGLLFGGKFIPYVKSTIHNVRAAANEAIPIDTQIDVARQELDAIGPAIKRMVHQIAKEKAEILRLESELDRKDANLEQSYEEMAQLRQHVESGDEVYVSTNERVYSTTAVKKDLKFRFTNYKRAKSTRDTLEEVITARREALQTAINGLEDARVQQDAMRVEIENLVARKKMIDVQSQTHNLELDNSAITRARQALEEVSDRIATREIEAEMLPEVTGSIPVTTGHIDMEKDILEEMDAFFNEKIDDNVMVNK